MQNIQVSKIRQWRNFEFIKNQDLVDHLVNFYNTDYKSWDTALKEYTRNIIAPYLMKFDHIPRFNFDRQSDSRYIEGNFTNIDISTFNVKPKSLNDYKEDIFIINMLRQKLFNLEGQSMVYKDLLKSLGSLNKQLESEIK